MKMPTIEELLDKEIARMESDWEKDPEHPDAKKEGPCKGFVYKGEKPAIICSDFFFWACSDGEDISEETLPELHKAIEDCEGDIETGALLYCARKRKIRPQGAAYDTLIPRKFWKLFHDCGEWRDACFGNPYTPGEIIKDEWSKKVERLL